MSNTPVIFLTSLDDIEDHARKLNAVAHLKKPVAAGRLLEVIELFVPYAKVA